MRLKTEHKVAGGILAVVALYFVVTGLAGLLRGRHAEAAPTKTDIPLVQATLIQPQMRPYGVTMRAHTLAFRVVDVRSETAGVVAATPVREGSFVKAGQVLCRLQVDARQAALDQARANLRSKQLQQKASADLVAKGYRSQTQMLTDQANLDQAAAAVRAAEVALAQTAIKAPFAGVYDKREAETGTYLSPGGACGMVIELDPLKVVGDVAETEIAQVRAGAAAHITLASGEQLDGTVYSVGKDADAQTRTYPVVVTARNPGSAVRSGLSAEVTIQAGEGPQHLIPSSALVLDSEGRQGVRYVGANNRVAFTPVTVIDETARGVWARGLTGPMRVITVGQSYVSEGQVVRVAAR